MAQRSETSKLPGVMGAVVSAYGPLAFGLVVVMIIWFGIAKPEIQASRLSFEQLQSSLKQQESLGMQMKQTAETMHQTAIILERTCSKMSE